MDAQQMLAAIAEPTRYRIVMLLAVGPRTVGEVTTALGALQPQTTKHIQTLELAGIVTVHSLGRRRVVSLNREAMRSLADHLGTLAIADPSESLVADYEAAIASAQADLGSHDRTLTFTRILPVPPARAWAAWTEPDLLSRWWAPRFFTVTECEFAPKVGAPLRLVLREGDGAEYESGGRMLEVAPQNRLRFELSPLGVDGNPVIRVEFEAELASAGKSATDLRVTIRVGQLAASSVDAAPMTAGLEIGWPQLLDQLAGVVGSAR